MLQTLMLQLSEYHLYLALWGILIIVSIVVELITDELTIIWGTVGGIFALLAALCSLNPYIQLIVFSITTAGSILFFRPLVKKYRKTEVSRTNADRIIGMVAVVTEAFEDENVGKVVVNGQTWRAIGASNQSFFEGEKVQVEGLTGTKVIVSKIVNNEKIVKL